MASSRVLILLALCVLPALLVDASRPLVYPYHIHGRVYCDTCHLGCEHKLVTYIKGAVVKALCKDKDTLELKYTSAEVLTGSDGSYVIEVPFDRQDDFCSVALVSSPQSDCNTIVPGLEHVTAVLTNENGVVSHERNVNSIGFKKNTKDASCAALVQLYNSDV